VQRCESATSYLVPHLPNNEPDNFFRFQVPVIDPIHCTLTQFFRDATTYPSEPTTRVISFLLFSLFAAVLLVAGFESTRSSAKLVASSVAMLAFCSQFMGVSMALPFIWLPSYLFSYAYIPTPPASLAPRNVLLRILITSAITLIVAIVMMNSMKDTYPPTETHAAQQRPSHWLVSIIQYIFQITGLSTFAEQHKDQHPINWLFLIFQYFPIGMPLLWVSFGNQGKINANSKKLEVTMKSLKSSETAKRLYSMTTGILAFLHIVAIQTFLNHTYLSTSSTPSSFPFEPLLQLLKTSILYGGKNGNLRSLPAYFLLVEIISVTLTMGLFVAYEGGFQSLLLYLVGSVFIGPGASLCAFGMFKEMWYMEKLEKGLAVLKKEEESGKEKEKAKDGLKKKRQSKMA
jgi:hypothetical protein